MQYADLILPLPINRYFTYRIPQEMDSSIHVGSRVIVPFGKKKYYTAIVVSLHPVAPTEYEVKDIYCVLDSKPVLRHPQLRFWEWIASYYMCSVGEVYKAAVPSGLKLESETSVSVNEEYEEDVDNRLNEKELAILSAFGEKSKALVADLEKQSRVKGFMNAVKSLLEKQAIIISEEIKSAYKPKLESYVRILIGKDEQDRLRELFDELNRSKKQLSLLMKYLELSSFFKPGALTEVSKKELLTQAAVTPAVLTSLVDKEVMEIYSKEISRLDRVERHTVPMYELNEFQSKAYGEIKHQFAEKDAVLLHGVTSSGKTEVYIHLIKDVIESGRQVLFMVPEIALTTQLTERLQRVFGDSLAIYHSKFSDNERVEIWNRLLNDDKIKIILGVRSSVFLPFRHLGLIIVDEEHETTYKQQDPAPRYNGKNAAIVLASYHGAKTLLGSATPSVETYYNALNNKYGLVELMTRHASIEMPQNTAVDIKELKKKKMMFSHFSPLLAQKINKSISSGQQAILFQNRRGFAPMIECSLCAWVPKCVNCDVSLTYHKGRRELTCHYCGYSIGIPNICPACGNNTLNTKGFGTEKIEEEIQKVFPESKVSRMDFDTTRTKKAYENIISAFQNKKSNILVGTQMISKGLDFDNVNVVGILSADSMINYPDFRSHEKALQMMSQVAGRAGRKNSR